MDLNQNLILAPLLIVELETLAPSWAIFDALIHLTCAPACEKWVVLDQIHEIWISPYVFDSTIVAFSTILLLVEDQYCLLL